MCRDNVKNLLLTPGFHWLHECSGTALCSAVCQHPHSAFQSAARPERVVRPRDFVVIKESPATTTSENLWPVDFRPGFAHIEVLFMKFGEIWSGVNTECFILKSTGCFNVVFVSDFLSRLICSVLNCCVVLRHRQNRSHTSGGFRGSTIYKHIQNFIFLIV